MLFLLTISLDLCGCILSAITFDFYDTFLNFEQFVLRQFSATIKRLQTDGGGEFVSHKLKQHWG